MMRRANDWIAQRITNAVGSMWCAYAFAGIALVSLPEAITAGLGPLVTWLAQTFLQLVLLSVIMVGQQISGRSVEARAQADHLALLAVMKRLHIDVKTALAGDPE